MRTKFALPAIVAVAALMLTGCVDNSTPTTPGGSSDNPAVGVDAAAVALLPDNIKSAGKLIIGIDPTYPPNESKDDAGNPVGWDVELADAMAAKLGLKTDYQISSFDKIIPSIKGGTYDIGVSSFTDNVEREASVDFVNYFVAGVQWAQPKGSNVDPANACGLTVSVQATTYEETDELPAASKKCTDAGKKPITILKFDKQDDATLAITDGRADAMSADTPITLYAISKLADKIEPAGASFEDAPYGIAVQKGSPLAKALQAALQSMVDDGSYMAILDKWGVGAGGITTITINAAANG
ncbi:polar amino acid transport system substrate-binding protein [Cryobacterium mesophilum]|uniref:ABC transporter substrate-binding protein n=1 Tax=Terrimesophilobacter mesophilus TaxID=433647 RepID=A0A4R8VDX1_9MICO|nr:ABC transporter substrate-binding protein [Terrimesophilobacter mesophilus]MBB5633669.1 polar amino acid transport system substrate-binding protein [Terrimesophilobacter mesophilus]TFB80360.1 ABC transporter substrate-binding protein [Terrimesophilobacter mesophilus]